MNRAATSVDVVAPQENPATAGARCPANPVRLTLAARLGNEIDGAWWPRTGPFSRELPKLVSVLEARLGEIVDINVNWSSLQCEQDLNWTWWKGMRPHTMTIAGRNAHAKLLVIPYRTGTALAVMLLRQAAGLPIEAAHRDSRAFLNAHCIIRAASGEPMF
jgi:Family of unknown function (DUF5994)